MIDRSTALTGLLPERRVLVSALAQGVERAAIQAQPVLVSVVVPFHELGLDTLTLALDLIPEDAFFWTQSGGDIGLLGIETALSLQANGLSRFQAIRQRWAELVRTAVVHETVPSSPGAPVGPLLMGGFAFDPLSEKAAAWREYPDGLMILPKVMVTATRKGAWLTLNGVVSESSDAEAEADTLHRTALHLERALLPVAGGRREGALPAPSRIELDEGETSTWRRAVESAAHIIRSGRLEKVVLARSVRARLRRGVSYGRVLNALMESYPECYTFLVRLQGQAFVGATPERLVALRGLDVDTMSLAGSTARSADPHEDAKLGQALLSDPKNLWEHQIVVDSIRDGLSDLCAHLEIADVPTLLKVRNVQHLWTPVSGRLESTRSVLDLVERLHPTPAVGGYPTQDALKLIREIEGIDRGWYAGPIGWMDRHSDGEFAVAIRSALLGDEDALLFAGCGIVGDSDPEAEYDESSLKLRPMIQALERSLR